MPAYGCGSLLGERDRDCCGDDGLALSELAADIFKESKKCKTSLMRRSTASTSLSKKASRADTDDDNDDGDDGDDNYDGHDTDDDYDEGHESDSHTRRYRLYEKIREVCPYDISCMRRYHFIRDFSSQIHVKLHS